MRRSPVAAVVAALSLCLSAPASAQEPFTPACGDQAGSLLTDTSHTTAHFRINGPGGTDLARIGAAFETVYSKLVTEFGWAPPKSTDSRIHIRAANVGAVRTETQGRYAGGNDSDKPAVCFLVPTNASDAALNAGAAREMSRGSAYAIGALTGPNAPDPWLATALFTAMEDVVHPALDAPFAQMPPDWDASLGSYEGPNAWLVVRGLTERFGTATAGGAEQVVYDTLALTGANVADNLTALEGALAGKGVTLAQAFHDYAIAAFFFRACGAAAARPHCFEDADAMSPGARTPHGTLGAVGDTYSGAVADDYALQWIAMPAAPLDLTVTNTAAAGSILATAGCATAGGLRLRALPQAIGAGASSFLRAVDLAGCDAPVVVVTSASRTAANPSESPSRTFQIASAPPTAVLGVARFGSGTITSSPAGIDCGGACAAVFPLGTVVTLTATPAAGQALGGWSGACSGTGPCSFTLDADKTVGAGFVAAPTTPAPKPGTPSIPGTTETPGTSADVTAPQVRFSRPRMNKARTRLLIPITCPAAETGGCTGPVTAQLRAGGKRYSFVGEALVGLAGGSSKIVTYRLSKSRARRVKRARNVRVTVAILARDEAFNYALTKKSFTLR